MSTPAWYWPPSGAQARGVALVPFASGMAVPDWTASRVWPFVADHFSAAIPLAGGAAGFAAAQPDSSGGLWLVSYDARLQHLAANGTPTFLAMLPQDRVWNGCVVHAGSPYAVAADGTVWTAGGVQAGAFGSAPALAAVPVSGGLAALLPAAGSVGILTLPGGVSGQTALPAALAIPACMAASGGTLLGVGGWSLAAPLSGAVALAAHPIDPTHLLAAGSGFALLWGASAVAAQNWTQSQALTGLANIGFAAWVPNGAQALLAAPVSGSVQVLSYAGEILSLAQSLAVSGASALAVTPDSAYALVCQPAQNSVQPLINTAGTWSISGAAIGGLSNAGAVLALDPATAVVAAGSGLTTLLLNAGVWIKGGTVPLGFTPTFLARDAFGLLYAAGSSGIAAVSGTAVVASGAWSGAAPTGLLVDQGRIVLPAPGSNLLRMFGLSAPGVLSQQATIPMALGNPVTVAVGGVTTLFLAGSGSTLTYGWSGQPFVPARVVAGAVGILDTGTQTWTTGSMGVGHTPSAVTFDASGNLWVGTTQNDLWSFSPSVVRLTSGIAAQYTGQPQSTSLGMSALLASSGHIYAATSLPGVLVEAV